MSQLLPLNPPRITPDVRTYCEAALMDWRNNYLTVEKFAEHNGLREDDARAFLAVAHVVFDSPHPEA